MICRRRSITCHGRVAVFGKPYFHVKNICLYCLFRFVGPFVPGDVPGICPGACGWTEMIEVRAALKHALAKPAGELYHSI